MLRQFLSVIISLTVSWIAFTGAHGAQLDDASTQKLKRFVHQNFIHGVPFKEASLYNSNRDVEILVSLLNDRKEQFYWPNIVSVLGMGRNPRATGALIAFIERGEGAVSREEYNAKVSAIIALGYLAGRDPKALDYLSKSLNPNVWSERLKWLPPYKYGISAHNLQLTKHAIQGLGLSGDAGAAKSLMRLRQSKSLGTVEVDSRLREIVDEALKANNSIRTHGLEAYTAAQQRQ